VVQVPSDSIGLSAEQYDSLLDQAEDVIFLIGGDQRYLGMWGRWISEHGLDETDFIGKTSWDLFGQDTRDFFEPLNMRVLDGERVSYERWFDVPWGGRIFYQTRLTPLRDDYGRIVGIIGIARDLTDLKEAHDRLEHAALHDPLTDLPNRTAFQNAVERAMAKSARGVESALLFVDVDDFKSCNESGGHALGDTVLTSIARALRNRVREPDIVARIGGDEFGIVLEGVDVEEARKRANELREAVRAIGRDVGYDLDLSVGVTPLRADSDFERTLAAADQAMYEAKGSHSKHVVVAHEQ
jgi:diguanylate cyclase (GGDEF)-like protein/PAS domain S-box-containing protein